MRTLAFFKEFVSEPVNVSSIVPSSRALAETVVDWGRVRDAGSVVEFGPGTGAVSEVIQGCLSPGATYFAMEISPRFVEVMARYHPDIRVIEDDALNAGQYLAEYGVDQCDTIISGLPFAAFEDGFQQQILERSWELLRPGGRFVTFTYVLSPYLKKGRGFRRRLREQFGEVEKSPIVWSNLPPAFAYCAIKENPN